jgi:4-nitrophenyl phosphatase
MSGKIRVKYMIIDMDGVLWEGDTPMPGLVSFFQTLAQHNIQYILATNNATRTPTEYTEKLARFGVETAVHQILNSAETTAIYLQQNYPAHSAVFVVGTDGLCQALEARGFVVATNDAAVKTLPTPPKIVVVGLDKQICYDRLATASLLVAAGADFIGTNPDPSYPSERGQLPGAGAIQAVITTTTGVTPKIIGKPERAMFDEARQRMGATIENTVMVGDRLTTDIVGAHAADLKTIMLLSGISQREDLIGSAVQPDFIFEDIRELSEALPLL